MLVTQVRTPDHLLPGPDPRLDHARCDGGESNPRSRAHNPLSDHWTTVTMRYSVVGATGLEPA